MANKKKHILINILTHGDELIGLRVKSEIEKLKIKQGVLEFNIANKKAYEKKKRFIESDLNRVFPGNPSGDYEQRLAFELLPKIKKADLVIDIHSTTTDLKDALIVTKFNKDIEEVVDIVNPSYLLYMKISKKTALISSAKAGIAFEYGKDKDKKALEKIVHSIIKIMNHFEIIEGLKTQRIKKMKKNRTMKFMIKNTFPKTIGQKLDKGIQNYTLVKKGQIVASSKKGVVKAREDFFPILFGQNNYKDIFGFMGKKIL